MTQKTIDLLVRIAIEIVDWINIVLKEKRGTNDRYRNSKSQSKSKKPKSSSNR
jgi:hypothetical protein